MHKLRRLVDVPAFTMVPLTLLVGRNSSGKSTYLRAIPLLKQSVVTRTSSPVLWYGDAVDFGSFEQSIHNNSPNGAIRFSFGLSDVRSVQEVSLDVEGYSFATHRVQFKSVFLEISIAKHGTGTRVSAINLSEKTNDVAYEIELDESGLISSLLVDGVQQVGVFELEELMVGTGDIFPRVQVRSKAKPEDSSSRAAGLRPETFLSVRTAIGKLVLPHLDGRTTQATLYGLIARLLLAKDFSRISVRATLEHVRNRSWIKFINNITAGENNRIFIELRRLLLIQSVISLLNSTSSALRQVIANSLYIGPARAPSERYYRYQDLAVSEIDSDGKNFPMFLNSLRASELEAFSDWVRSIFKFGVDIGRESGHMSIRVTGDRGAINIVDTGYGISQILPVLGQIWWANRRPRQTTLTPDTLVICVEQPELHLHPAHQALLAKVFVNSPKRRPSGNVLGSPSLVVETHSETLINEIGALVAAGEADPSDVQILVFEEDRSDDSVTNVRRATFDEQGFLQNWPYGFFLPES